MTLLRFTWACAVGSAIAAVDSNNAWQYPGYLGVDTYWPVGSSQPLRWYTQLTDYNVTLWQSRAAPDYPLLIGKIWESTAGNSAGNISYDWTVTPLDADLGVSQNFYLWAGWLPDGKSDNGFTSYSFNMTYPPGRTSSIASTATTAAATASRSQVETPSASPAAATSPTSNATDADDSSSSSTGNNSTNSTSIGIGVGAGLGGALIIIACFFLGTRYAKQRRTRDEKLPDYPIMASVHEHDPHDGAAAPHYDHAFKSAPAVYTQQHELPIPPVELPSHDGKPRELGA